MPPFPEPRGPSALPLAAAVLVAFASTAAGATPSIPSDLAGRRLSFSATESERCLRCHGMTNFAVRDSATGLVRDLHVDSLGFRASAHGRIACAACHAEVTAYPHELGGRRAPVSCGAGCHAIDRRGRPVTHAREAAEFASSVHARGRAAASPDSPVCTSCHGAGSPHGIRPVRAQMTPAAKIALCAGCHDDRARMTRARVNPDAVASYRRSFHYKAIRFGAGGTAVCQDCHTPHHVLAKSDSASTIAAARLPRTCGQERCHRGARMNFALTGANHLELRVRREPLLLLEERFFLLLTAGTLLALVGGIALDVQRRLGGIRLAAALARRARAAACALGRGARVHGRAALVHSRRLLLD